MNADTRAALRLLAQPGAVLIDTSILRFGFKACLIEQPHRDIPLDGAVYQALIKAGYIAQIAVDTYGTRYQLTIAGAEALAEREKANETHESTI